MKFLNGWKTVLGVLGVVATPFIAAGGHPGDVAGKVVEIGTHLDSVLMGASALLLSLGIIHKVEKGQV